jgi:hypothetical protein
VSAGAGLGDGDGAFARQHPGERHLGRRRLVVLADGVQGRVLQQAAPLPDRRIGHHRHPAFAAEGQQVPLGAAMLQVQQHLVRRAIRQRRTQRLQVSHVEVGHAPGADLSGRAHPFHRLHRIGQGHAAAPMQQIEIQRLHPQAAQAPLAGKRKGAAGCIVGIHLGHQDHAIAQAGDGLADKLLGFAVRIHLGGVDQGEAAFDPFAQARDLLAAAGRHLRHAPGALPHGSGEAEAGHARLPHVSRFLNADTGFCAGRAALY